MVGLWHAVDEPDLWIMVPFCIVVVEACEDIDDHGFLLLLPLSRFKPVQVQLLMVSLLEQAASSILSVGLLLGLLGDAGRALDRRRDQSGVSLDQHVFVRPGYDLFVRAEIALAPADVLLLLGLSLPHRICPRLLLVLESPVELDLGEDEELGSRDVAGQTRLVGPVLDCIIFAVEHTLAEVRDLDLSEIVVGGLLLGVLHLGGGYAGAELVFHHMGARLLDQLALGQVLLPLLSGRLLGAVLQFALVNDLADLKFAFADDKEVVAGVAFPADDVAALVALPSQTQMQGLQRAPRQRLQERDLPEEFFKFVNFTAVNIVQDSLIVLLVHDKKLAWR